MPTTPHVGYDLEKLTHFRELAQKAGADAVRFRIVERFLCEVDRWLLKLSGPVFEVSRIKESIQKLKAATIDDDPSILAEAELQIEREFQLWRQQIEAKDRSIETYNFRRFCDSAAEPLDNDIFVALAAFYRESSYSQNNQSKFDLVVTRLFTDIDASGRRFLRYSSRDIADRTEQLLGSLHTDEEKDKRFLDNAGAVTAIHSFIAEAHGLDDFESLIECRLFDRYRDFKKELGVQFYEPTVIAAAVQCNAVFANAFNEMLEAANDNLSEILRPELDISAALHDPSIDAQAHLSDLLTEFFNIEPVGQGKEGDHIWELLSLASERGAPRASKPTHPQTAAAPAPLAADFDVSRSARERMTPFLETLMKAEPDAGLLLAQLNRSRNLRELNLSNFLYAENYSPDMRSRRILGLILWLEEFAQHELTTQQTLTPTGQQEVLTLIQKSEELAMNLRAEIQASDGTARPRLLTVLNALLESRLRLEGAIVRFTSRNISQNRSEEERREETRIEAAGNAAETTPQRSSNWSWLLWLLIIAVLAAVAFYFYPTVDHEPGTAASVTVKIDANSLPGHDWILSAYKRDNTMFVTADQAWLQLPSDKQKESLKALMESSGEPPVDSVVIRDRSGRLLGNASVYGVYVPQESRKEN